ncbi:MAG: hypothetical protein JJU36_06565 [Phycisphaeraceae bacterium]|nr:hypothetical protein [Phycisphaeraceae bacterium]
MAWIAVALFAAVCVIGTFAVLRYPGAALGIAASMFVMVQFGRVMGGPFLVDRYLPYAVLAIPVVVSIMARLMRGQRILMPLSAGGIAWYLLMFWSAATLIWHYDLPAGLDLINRAQFLILFGFLVAPLLVSDLREFRQGMVCLILISVPLIGLILLYGGFAGRGLVIEHAYGDMTTNPLALSTYAGYVLIAALLMVPQKSTLWWTIYRWTAIALASWLSIQSESRGQLIFSLVIVLAFMPIARPIRNIKQFAAVSIGGLVFLSVFLYLFAGMANIDRFMAILDDPTQNRGRLVAQLFSFWAEAGPVYWLLGLGEAASMSYQIVGIYCHILTPEILAEKGIVGLIIWMCVVGYTVVHGVRLIRMSRNSIEARSLATALFAVFVFSFLVFHKQGSYLGSASSLLPASIIFIARIYATTLPQFQAFELLRRAWWARSGHAQQIGMPVPGTS